MDFAHLARYDRETLTRSLDMAALCAVLGIELDSSGMGFCPFHDNKNTPAFSTFIGEDGKPRFHCHGCGARGDVLDLVGLKLNLSYGDALHACVEYAESGLPEPAPRDSEPVDFAPTVDNARSHAAADASLITLFLAERNSPIDPAWLITEFRLGIAGNEILMPHYARGVDTPHAVKRRLPDGKRSLSGSRLRHLYGDWRDRGRKTVFLVEGESDTWTLAWDMRDAQVDVLGLPRGVDANPETEWIDLLRGRHVYLAFDGDDTARRGLKKWAGALLEAADSIHIVHFPEGSDLSAVSAEERAVAIREAKYVRNPASLPVTKGSNAYLREPSSAAAEKGAGPAPLTDWLLTILRRVEVPGKRIYFDVELPNGRRVRISDADLRNSDTITRWCNPHGLAWRGRGADTQELLRLFELEALFVPRVLGVDLAGWHEGSFVFPEPAGTIGSPAYAYTPPDIDAQWDKRLCLAPGSPSRDIPDLLVRLHTPEVMTPIVGWIAAAPLRALCPQFPTLGVMGSAGAGKTTIMSEALKTFGYSDGTPQSVANTTSHGVWGQVGSTNAIPVWFDEYRFGAREDGLRALDQAIRDAWNGAASMRGGVGDNKSALVSFPALAPICVTGESAFQEQSHAERMVIVSLTRDGRNRTALEALQSCTRQGFGRDYLEWLLRAHDGDLLPAPPALSDRMEQAVAVVGWGYEIFRAYCRDSYGLTLPDFDASLILDEQRSLTDTPPIFEALREFHNVSDRSGHLVVWCAEDDVCVRYGRLTRLTQSETTIVLPGNDKALRKWLTEQFPGTREMRGGVAGRYLVLPSARTTIFG